MRSGFHEDEWFKRHRNIVQLEVLDISQLDFKPNEAELSEICSLTEVITNYLIIGEWDLSKDDLNTIMDPCRERSLQVRPLQ